MIRIGLRFRRSDARLLRDLADRVRQGEMGEQHVSTFRDAADAAATGEPLIVLCEEPFEAEMMADGYARFGVPRPAIEELTGQRPAK